jgi:hypothetical protein
MLGLLVACLATVAGPALAADDFALLAAHYLEARGDGHAPARPVDWYLNRQPLQVEIARATYVEIWKKDDRGEVSWQRIFHDDRKRITYSPGDLRAESRALSWPTLNTVLDFEQVLANLHPVGKMTFLDRPATRYAGKIGNEEIDLIWLDEEKLPGRMLRRGLHLEDSLVLQELRAEPAPDWPSSDPARSSDYEEIDGADLGDREYDPFVRKVQAMDGHQHAH